ncbi:MAG: cytochrome c maturation protein CcmE [Candidatus Eisenbacteria bacterium]
MRPRLLIGLLLVLASIGFGVTAFKKSLTPYISFSEAKRSGGSVQVNGVLADPAAVRYDADRTQLVFALKDDKNEVMEVVYKGVKPVNFEQATSVVAIGTYQDGKFTADQLLVKCPSKYQAEANQAAASGPARSAAPAATPASAPVPTSGGY